MVNLGSIAVANGRGKGDRAGKWLVCPAGFDSYFRLTSGLTRSLQVWEIPIMAQSVTIAKHDKRKRLVLPDDFVAEAPYGEYIIREGKGHLSIIAIPAPKTKRTYAATPAL